MKELTTYNRVAGYLNKVFDMLNTEFFENALSRPTITIQSTPRAYGHFSLREDTWLSKLGATHELNLGAGTLARPIENVAATLLHEMVHLYCYESGIKDTSRGFTYHNKRFKVAAESHGLIVAHHEKYGWSITSPSDALLDFVLETGTHSSGGTGPALTKKSSSRKYVCPCCKNSVGATKLVNIGCLDCQIPMMEV